jgi:hypothetical protein
MLFPHEQTGRDVKLTNQHHITLLLILQERYVQHKNKARSRNHCCSVKEISIVYSECVSVGLAIYHAVRMHCIFICEVSEQKM